MGVGCQEQLADDAIPIPLGLIGNAVGILSDIDLLYAVVDSDGDAVTTRGEAVEVEFLLRGQVVGGVSIGVVDPEGDGAVGAFEYNGDVFIQPVLGDIDV